MGKARLDEDPTGDSDSGHLQLARSSQVKYNEDRAERQLVVCSAYVSCDSENPQSSTEFQDLVRYGESENIYLMIGCDSSEHHIACGSTNCDDKRRSPGGLSQFFESADFKSGQCVQRLQWF